MKCEWCGGAIIYRPGNSVEPARNVCMACGREPKSTVAETSKSDGGKTMSNRLNPEKEREVKAFLKDHSVRETVAKTGVAKNTIARIRNENFTEEEKSELKKRANVKGRNRRELKKREPKADLQNDGRNIPKNIPPADSGGKGGQAIMEKETKVCTKCGTPKTISEFNKNAARPDGHESRCRTCTAQAQRDRKASIEKSSGGTGRSRKAPGNGRKKRRPRDPWPCRSLSAPTIPSEAVTLDAQLLKAVKKSAILDFVKNDLPRMIEERFA